VRGLEAVCGIKKRLWPGSPCNHWQDPFMDASAEQDFPFFAEPPLRPPSSLLRSAGLPVGFGFTYPRRRNPYILEVWVFALFFFFYFGMQGSPFSFGAVWVENTKKTLCWGPTFLKPNHWGNSGEKGGGIFRKRKKEWGWFCKNFPRRASGRGVFRVSVAKFLLERSEMALKNLLKVSDAHIESPGGDGKGGSELCIREQGELE